MLRTPIASRCPERRLLHPYLYSSHHCFRIRLEYLMVKCLLPQATPRTSAALTPGDGLLGGEPPVEQRFHSPPPLKDALNCMCRGHFAGHPSHVSRLAPGDDLDSSFSLASCTRRSSGAARRARFDSACAQAAGVLEASTQAAGILMVVSVTAFVPMIRSG